MQYVIYLWSLLYPLCPFLSLQFFFAQKKLWGKKVDRKQELQKRKKEN